MKQGKISIDGSRVSIEPGTDGQILLTRSELANLFGVYYGTITANIKAVIKSRAVKPSFDSALIQIGKMVLPEYYDMEMVIALAFRLDSPAAERIRRYVIGRVATGTERPYVPVILNFGVKSRIH